jgi:GTP-binding protein
MDLPEAREAWLAFAAARRGEDVPCVAISADAGDGLDALRALLAQVLPDAAGLAAEPEPTGVVVHRLDAAGDGFTMEREGDAFRIRGKRIERIAVQTNFEVEESAERFQRDLDRLGIDGALRRAGVQPGDTVRIGRVEFEWGASAWDDDAR